MAHRAVTPFANGIGDNHVRPDRNAHEQVDEQIDDEGVCTDRRQSLVTGELPHYGNVRQIEQLLKNAAQGNGNGKPQDFSTQGAI